MTARRVRRPGAVALVALVALGLLVAVTGWRRVARGLRAAGPLLRRRLQRAEPPPFAALAVSQVGYAPGMTKEFTAPGVFGPVRIEDVRDGTVVLTVERPTRVLEVDAYGPVRTMSVGDASALRRPGRYRLVDGRGRASHPFDVGRDVFDEPVRAVQRAFYFQRAFTAVEASWARGPWVHASDAARAPPGVHHGWHDAGDYSIYNADVVTALHWMFETLADFAPTDDDLGIPESGNGVPDLLDEARWGVEWLLSVQDASGGFQNVTCLDHYGPYGDNPIERGAPYRAGEVGTLATARAVGALAYAAWTWRPVNGAFADRLLAAARRGQAYLDLHPGEASDGPSCPAYRADGDRLTLRHVGMYAAAAMLLATGEPRFAHDFEEAWVELDYDPSFKAFNGFAAAVYLRAPAGTPARKRHILAQLARHAALARDDAARHPFGWAPRLHWGSVGAAFTRTGAYSARACRADPEGARADCDVALGSVHAALGRNWLQFCFVSGLHGVTRGREGAFHHWLATLRAEPHDFPGMVAGGPNARPEPDDRSLPWNRPVPAWGYVGDPAFPRDDATPVEGRYTDNDSWSTNEVSLDWQASALYGLHLARWLARREPVETPAAPSPPPGRR